MRGEAEYDPLDEDGRDNFSEGHETVEDDASDGHDISNLPDFDDDEAYARALQGEEQEMAVRLLALAGISECQCLRNLMLARFMCLVDLKIFGLHRDVGRSN